MAIFKNKTGRGEVDYAKAPVQSADGTIIFFNDHPKSLFLSNIKFILNIQINTIDTKHLKQILVILFESQ